MLYARMKPVNTPTSMLLLGYLAFSTTLPFMLSYKESLDNQRLYVKGTVNARSLFNKV